jgi:hypothetical protein
MNSRYDEKRPGYENWIAVDPVVIGTTWPVVRLTLRDSPLAGCQLDVMRTGASGRRSRVAQITNL